MRWAFGAGAVAAMTVITVGFVQPDSSASEEAAVSVDSSAQTATPQRPEVEVNRKTRYVLLRPGQRAPRGATVIEAKDLPRGARARQLAGARQARDAGRARDATTNARRPKPDRAPANERPTTQEAPRPQQPPRTTTRQSG